MSVKKLILPFLLILIVLLIKFSNFQSWFGFDYDQEINGLLAKVILIDKKPLLIGPETSVGGMYVGPMFNYIIAIFYFLGKMDPMWTIGLNFILATSTLVALYFVAKKIFGTLAATISVIIYGFSYDLTKYDRVLWNPTPMPLVSILLLYFLYTYIKTKKTYSLFFATLLVGIAFQLHLTAIFLLAFFGLALLFFSPKTFLDWKNILIMTVTFLFFLSPLIVFDFRHQFLITKHFLDFFLGEANRMGPMGRNLPESVMITASFLKSIIYPLGQMILDVIFIALFTIGSLVALYYQKTKHALILKLTGLLIALALIGFFLYKGPLPSQYSLFLLTPFVLILSAFLAYLFQSNKIGKVSVLLFLITFLMFNLPQTLAQSSNLSLKDKKNAVEKISTELAGKNAEIVFITSPGLDTGFKYLLWQSKVKYTRDHAIKSDVVFKVIMPSDLINKKHLSGQFGSIGIIGPEIKNK